MPRASNYQLINSRSLHPPLFSLIFSSFVSQTPYPRPMRRPSFHHRRFPVVLRLSSRFTAFPRFCISDSVISLYLSLPFFSFLSHFWSFSDFILTFYVFPIGFSAFLHFYMYLCLSLSLLGSLCHFLFFFDILYPSLSFSESFSTFL